MSRQILTVCEVADLMRVSKDTIYHLAAKGELPGRKVGRAWRFSREAITHYLATGPAARETGSSRTVPETQSFLEAR